MIKKLRHKFVAVIVGSSALILLVVFGVLLITTYNSMVEQTTSMLETVLYSMDNHVGRYNEPPALYSQKTLIPFGKGENERRIMSFTVSVSGDSVHLTQEQFFFLASEYEVEELIDLSLTVAGSEKASGYLSSYGLRYLKHETTTGINIAFADASNERSTLVSLINSSLLIGLSAMVLIFGASILLARWAVRPVERAWAQQKQFVGDASHELKTPLTVILSNVDMMLNHDSTEIEKKRWTNNIRDEAVRMKDLTEQLLLLARSDEQVNAPELEEIDLSYIVSECLLTFEPIIYEAGKRLDYDVQSGISVKGDRASLIRLIAILLDNAIKYSRPNGKIGLSLVGNGKTASIAVSSEGEEIEAEKLDRLFERFYQVSPSRHGEGHGLGLSIAYNTVTQHKGTIRAESKEGINTFFITLPLIKT